MYGFDCKGKMLPSDDDIVSLFNESQLSIMVYGGDPYRY